MRVSSHQYHLNTIRNIQQGTADYSKLATQLATNSRILKPSDDPLGAVMLLTLDSELKTLEQYQNNMQTVNYNLGQQETQLSSIVNILSTMQGLVTTAANDASGDVEMQAKAQELGILFPGIVDLLNAKDGTGRYYFSGSQTDTQPFVLNAGGDYEYVGDSNIRYVDVSDNSSVVSNIVGSDLVPGNDFLNQMKDYLALLNDPNEPLETKGDASRQMIDNIASFLEAVSTQITTIGATRSSLDTLGYGNEEIANFTENLRDDIKVVDYPEAYINLNESLASYEASLRVYSSVNKLSLFQYL